MNTKLLEKKAKSLKDETGGILFGFPIEEDNPFSKYAVVMWAGNKWHVYPEAEDISFAAGGIQIIMDQMDKSGKKMNFERDVRLVSYEAQINAPSVTMRRIRNEPGALYTCEPAFKDGEDVHKLIGVEGVEDGELGISARGIIKFSYLAWVDDNKPTGKEFMDEYCKLLATKKYGKTTGAIKQELRRMSKQEAIKWIESTYKRYITDSMEIMNIFIGLKEKHS